MATIVQCNCGAEYRRTEEKFLAPHTGDAVCTVCGAALESWEESTHVPIYELIERPQTESRHDKPPQNVLGGADRSMAPSLLVKFGFEARRRSRLIVTRIARGTGCSRAATGAGVLTFPWAVRVVLANPAAILANRALHWSRFSFRRPQ